MANCQMILSMMQVHGASQLLEIHVLRIICFYFIFTIFLLNGSYWRSQKILMSLISIGHVVENAMLVDVDSGARVACTNWTF